jgi:histidyl-tRNA synthetase
MALSTQPYKGARDFYPEDERLQKYMFTKIRKVAETFGYEEYNAPILEPLELYLAKTGEEIVNEQTYVFEDRGGRKVVIRPEMTPTVSRMVAARRQELAYPVRWYSIPNLWRYERPQRGRLREHWQLNMDIFGITNSFAEQEIIMIVNAMFNEFGASKDMYVIKLNSRKFMNYVFDKYLKLSEQESHAITKLIDRMNKMERAEFITRVTDALAPESQAAATVEKLLEVLDSASIDSLPKELQSQENIRELSDMLNALQGLDITNVAFDVTLMRGFDYYTDIVFEVFDTHPDNNRSMLGGGRYDGLVGLFGVEPVPTVGFGWGDVTLANFLKIHELVPPLDSETDVYIIGVSKNIGKILELASRLRELSVSVAVDMTERRIGDQFKVADKKHIKYALIVGDDDLKLDRYNLKELGTGVEQSLGLEDISKMLKASRSASL